MTAPKLRPAAPWLLPLLLAALAGCHTPPRHATAPPAGAPPRPAAVAPVVAPAQRVAEADALRVDPRDAMRADRVSFGVDAVLLQAVARQGWRPWLDAQLHPPAAPATLPADVAAKIALMRVSREPLAERARADDAQRKAADALTDPEQNAAAHKAYQQALNTEANEAAQRWLLMAVHSPWQVQERMVWFWLNHFNVFLGKGNLRGMVGDYEQALRPLALGRFRDLLEVAALHPAMLRYLDNERNAAGHLNENFARELLELHTLGVEGGYAQADVQELARVLTGLGIRLEADDAKLKPAQAAQYVRRGLMEFHPGRHDAGAKTLLGQPVPAGGGLDEIRAVLARLARHPATAQHIARDLARYFVADAPPQALVDRLAARFLATDGEIAAVLQTLFTAPEFEASLGTRFKDPWQYVVSATRLAYDGSAVLEAGPLVNHLQALGQPVFGRTTPDGWPPGEAAWSGPGQLATRFDVARALVGGSNGGGNARLFRTEGVISLAAIPPARIASAAWLRTQGARAGAATQDVLAEALAARRGEWAWVALASPEFMRH